MFQSLTWLYGVVTLVMSCVVLQLNMNNMQMNSAMILFTQHDHARWLLCGHETLFYGNRVPLVTMAISYVLAIHNHLPYS